MDFVLIQHGRLKRYHQSVSVIEKYLNYDWGEEGVSIVSLLTLPLVRHIFSL